MERLTAMLTRRLGPLPVWTWALVGVAGVLFWAYWRARNRPLDAAPVPGPDDAPADAGVTDALDDFPSDGYTGPGPREITFSSNQAWARYVLDKLTIRGEDPTLVSNAISKVLYGQEVTAQEAAVFNDAVRLFGAPPEPFPIIRIIQGPQQPNPDPDPDPDPDPPRRLPPPRELPNPGSPPVGSPPVPRPFPRRARWLE